MHFFQIRHNYYTFLQFKIVFLFLINYTGALYHEKAKKYLE